MTLLRSRLLSSFAPLYGPDGVVSGAAGGAPAAAEPEASAAAPAAAADAVAPVIAPDAGAAPAGADKPAADAGAADAGAPGKDLAAAPGAEPAAAAAKPAQEFAPSLLDEAAKPTADAVKPGETAPVKDAAKPDATAKPSDKKEPAAAEAKPGEQAKPAEPPAPIEYAFKYPEGVKPEDLNAEQMSAFTGILNEGRTPPEVGQKLLDLHLAELNRVAQDIEQRTSEHQWEVFAEQQRKSREEVMADPELGGARHDTAIRSVMSVLDAYGMRDQNSKNPRTTEVIAAERKQLLDDFRATGIANRASLLRLLNWTGETFVREGKPRPAPPPRNPSPNPATRGLRRYQGTTPAAT